MKKRLVSKVIIFIMVSLIFSGCGGKSDPTFGGTIDKKIKAEKTATVGNALEDGWQIDISKDTFDDDVKLKMDILTTKESKEYKNDDFKFYGTPVEFSIDGEDNVRLNKPIKATLKIPSKYLEDAQAEDLFFAYYYDNNWEYYIPDSIDLEKGTATFTLYHFSFLGFGKPSEEEQYKTYAKAVATNEWNKEANSKEYLTANQKQFDDLFSQMGVKSQEARNQLMADVVSYLDSSDVGYFDYLAQSANSGSKGTKGNLDFENKYKEFLGKAIYSALEKNPASFSAKVNIFGNLASAAGSIAGGDNKAALQSIANILNTAVPVSQLAASTSAFIAEKANQAIDYWAQSELDKAYQVYKTGVGGKWGYEDGLQGDFDTIFTLLGGGDRQVNIKIIQKYCETRGLNEKDLTEDKRNEIIANAKSALKKNFDSRIISDYEISEKAKNEEAFIAELKKEGLLSASSNKKYFGIDKKGSNFDIKSRLDRIYNIKNTVLNMMDKDEASKISDEFLAKAISQWIYWSEKKDMAGFYKYMRDLGYIKEVEYKADCAWVLVDIEDFESAEKWELQNKHEVYDYEHSYSRGSYSAKTIYTGATDDWYNPPMVHGEALGTKAVFSTPPKVIKAGEPVTLTLSLSVTDNSISFFRTFGASANATIDSPGIEAGYGTGGAIQFANKDKEYYFQIGGSLGYDSVNETITAIAPSGSEGQRIAIRTGFSMGCAMCTNYVYEWKTP